MSESTSKKHKGKVYHKPNTHRTLRQAGSRMTLPGLAWLTVFQAHRKEHKRQQLRCDPGRGGTKRQLQLREDGELSVCRGAIRPCGKGDLVLLKSPRCGPKWESKQRRAQVLVPLQCSGTSISQRPETHFIMGCLWRKPGGHG